MTFPLVILIVNYKTICNTQQLTYIHIYISIRVNKNRHKTQTTQCWWQVLWRDIDCVGKNGFKINVALKLIDTGWLLTKTFWLFSLRLRVTYFVRTTYITLDSPRDLVTERKIQEFSKSRFLLETCHLYIKPAKSLILNITSVLWCVLNDTEVKVYYPICSMKHMGTKGIIQLTLNFDTK
jgi:hypothetical protein